MKCLNINGAMAIFNPDFLFSQPWLIFVAMFQVWMIVDAIRRSEWVWAVFLFIFPGLTGVLYFFLVYRSAAPLATQGFELPGAQSRHRIKELQSQIHLLDKAHHHLELADVYFRKGDFKKAEASYRASIERDAEDKDARAHLGQCLLRLGRPEEARALLEQVCREDQRHDYGYTLMAYAESLMALKQTDAAIAVWKQVLQEHSYARARVQLAELYILTGKNDLAQNDLREVLNDDVHAPAFQRRRDRVWIRRAKRLKRG